MKTKHLIGALGWLLATTSLARAEIVTDRPDVAESSETVGAGRFQLETGVHMDATGGGERLSLSSPLKLRLGVTSGFELHLETAGLLLELDRPGGDQASTLVGLGALDLGFKVHLWEGRSWLPSTGLLVALTLPAGGAEGTSLMLSPTLAADWEITEALSLGVNVGLTVTLASGATHAARYAVAMGRTLAPLTDRLRIYAEVSGESPLGDGEHQLLAGGGLSLLLTPTLQLDMLAFAGLTEASPEAGGGLGVSFKL